MRIRNFKEAKDILENSKILISNPQDYYGKFNSLFGNDNPIHLEIGMGKGNFLLGNAVDNPNINYIGIEKYDTIVARALQKIEPKELSNLKIIRGNAMDLDNIFNREIDVIYLNFSDPWPKDRHAKRRLTSKVFLNVYDKIFKSNAEIVMKTDNLNLFNYSIESLKEHGYDIIQLTNDLEKSNIDNIRTEYEEKFMALGIKINYLKATKNKI